VLAANFGVPADAFKKIPVDNLCIFQGHEPGPLAAAQKAAESRKGPPALPFIFSLSDSTPVRKNAGGQVQIADSRNFNMSGNIAAALVTVKPGGMRELHWHPNADEWQYYVKGEARMTVFDTGPKAQTADFRPGDVGYVPKSLGQYVKNVGDTDLQFLELFKSDKFSEVSLSDCLAHTPAEMVTQTLNISPDVITKFPRDRPDVMPEY
jgi:oxalate decarboxylase